MVKGISKQVIVVHSPDPKLFDQAIFILKDDVVENGGITDDQLLLEAKKLLRVPKTQHKYKALLPGPMWACFGAAIMGAVWLLTILL